MPQLPLEYMVMVLQHYLVKKGRKDFGIRRQCGFIFALKNNAETYLSQVDTEVTALVKFSNLLNLRYKKNDYWVKNQPINILLIQLPQNGI